LDINNTLGRQQAVYRMGDPNKPLVALTFDDGPDTKWTPQILNALATKGVKATFFVLGREVEKNPQVAARIVREGHVIANHGYTHVSLTQLSPAQMSAQLTRANSAIAAATGVQPRLLRPVGGAYNQTVLNVASQHGFSVILWSVDPQDWRGINAATIINRVVSNTGPGSIILLHSGEGPNLTGTVQAVPQIIDQLRARGLQFVTVAELLNLPAYR
jgi:peptidoglycan/xylan/chitin deacetylase (PgdA/CDA1 family)